MVFFVNWVVPDKQDADIKQYFDECINFIDEAKRTGGGVLVHCIVGKSRRWFLFRSMSSSFLDTSLVYLAKFLGLVLYCLLVYIFHIWFWTILILIRGLKNDDNKFLVIGLSFLCSSMAMAIPDLPSILVTSCSVTIVVAYLMKKQGMSKSEALHHVRSKRSIASPNPGFRVQLKNFEKSLHGGQSFYSFKAKKFVVYYIVFCCLTLFCTGLLSITM